MSVLRGYAGILRRILGDVFGEQGRNKQNDVTFPGYVVLFACETLYDVFL